MLNHARAAVVTGTSTGFGHASAALLAQRGLHMFGSVRKQRDAKRLKAELGPACMPLVFDLSDKLAVHAAAAQVRRAPADMRGQR